MLLLCYLIASLILLLGNASWASISVVGRVTCEGSTDGNGFTSASKDTSGATAIVVFVSALASHPDATISDSASNSYGSPLIDLTSGSSQLLGWVLTNPTTSTTHTWTVSNAAFGPSICVSAWSGTPPLSIVDGSPTVNTNTGTTTAQPGRITPAAKNELLITAFGSAETYSSIDAPFSPADASVSVSGNHFAIGIAHEIQKSAKAQNPTWTWPATTDKSAVLSVLGR